MIKGKILLIVTLLIALVLTAAAAFGGYISGTALYEAFGQTFALYDLSQLPVILAAIAGAVMFLITLPSIITARQVCRMYNVSRKYAKWSGVTITVGILLLLLVGGAIAGVVYLLKTPEVSGAIMLLFTLAKQNGTELPFTLEQCNTYLPYILGCVIFVLSLLLFNPIMVALRGRDGVSALLKKKRAHSTEE